MLRRVRELGPPMLVPFAWSAVAANHLGALGETGMLIAHGVMLVCLVVFAVTGRPDMQDGVLRVWWLVIAAGIPVTAAGLAGFFLDPLATQLFGISLVGWMLLPAAGFVYTGQRVPAGRWIYLGGTAGCLVGALLYVAGLLTGRDEAMLAGIALVGIGQTAGIFDAAIRY